MKTSYKRLPTEMTAYNSGFADMVKRHPSKHQITNSMQASFLCLGFHFLSALPSYSQTLNTLSESEKKDGWELLFDGKKIDKWHTYNQTFLDNDWEVKDGAIHLANTSKPRNGSGDLTTNEDFSDFDLKLEWKIASNGNSGVLFYVQENLSNYQPPFFTGLEMQVLDNSGNKPDAHVSKHRAGDLYDLIEATEETAKPVGQWNQIEISCNKGQLKLWQNETSIITTTLWDDKWRNLISVYNANTKRPPQHGLLQLGKIDLQNAGDEVWFRNIKIKRLTPATTVPSNDPIVSKAITTKNSDITANKNLNREGDGDFNTIHLVPESFARLGFSIVYKDKLYYTNARDLVEYDGNSVKKIPNPDGGECISDPIIFNGKLYIKYQVDDKNYFHNNHLAEFDGNTLKIIPNPTPGAGYYKGNPIEFAGRLYFGYQSGSGYTKLAYYDGNSISVINNPSQERYDYAGSPIVYNGILYVRCYNGSGFSYLGKLNGNKIEFIPNPGKYMYVGNPIVFNGVLYLGYSKYLAAYNGYNVSIVPNAPNGDFTEPAIIYDDRLYCKYAMKGNSQINELVAFDGTSFNVVPNPSNGGVGYGTPCVLYKGKVYTMYCSQECHLAQLDYSGFTLIENPEDGQASFMSPLVFKGKLYFGCSYERGYKSKVAVFDGKKINVFPNPEVDLQYDAYVPPVSYSGTLYLAFANVGGLRLGYLDVNKIKQPKNEDLEKKPSEDLIGKWRLTSLKISGQNESIASKFGTDKVYQVFNEGNKFQSIIGDMIYEGTWQLSSDKKKIIVSLLGNTVEFDLQYSDKTKRVVSSQLGILEYVKQKD